MWIRTLLLCLALTVGFGPPALAVEAPGSNPWFTLDENDEVSVNLHFFWSSRCPHCREAHPFVKKLTASYPWLRVHSRELLQYPENVELYVQLAGRLGQEAQSVPAFLFCGQMYVGYDNAQGMGAFLERKLNDCHLALQANSAAETAPVPNEAEAPPLTLPFVGELDPSALSLPVFTLVIAGMDAFNPCAFFVLLFLLSLLIHAQSRARMFAIGGIFVFFSGLIYFIFMAAWLNVFLVTGELQVITAVAGALAVVVALINIKDYFWFKAGVSLSIPDAAKPGLFKRMRGLVNAQSLPAMTLGAVTLAAVANGYELLCTAGFPVVYTRILTLNELPSTSYYLYLAFYNLIYIIPLALIVTVFSLTLGSRKLSQREGRVLKLLSGLMMLGLGAVLLLAPDLLDNVLVAVTLLAGATGITIAIVTAERLLPANRKRGTQTLRS